MAKLTDEEFNKQVAIVKSRIVQTYKNLFLNAVHCSDDRVLNELDSMCNDITAHIIGQIKYNGCSVDDFYPEIKTEKAKFSIVK